VFTKRLLSFRRDQSLRRAVQVWFTAGVETGYRCRRPPGSGPSGPSARHTLLEHYLPRPLTADQDRLIQQELLRRDDCNSNAFLLLRHTGMRIAWAYPISLILIVCLSIDCVRATRLQTDTRQLTMGKKILLREAEGEDRI
jgi:hypothetical protein